MRAKWSGTEDAERAPARRARVAVKRPIAAASVLNSVLKRYGLDREIARYQFVLKWEEIVGKEIARRTRPECLRGGSLVVRVSNSVWAQELSFYKPVILNRLKKHLPVGEMVKDLTFYVG